jgi:hypothetical protein
MDDTQEIGRAIRALLDDYTPPPDLHDRIAKRVRARRNRAMAVSLVATVTVFMVFLAVAAPASFNGASHGDTFRPAEARASPDAAGDQLDPLEEINDGSVPGSAYVVSRGSVAGRSYVVASTTFGLRGAACLFAADALFNRLSWCSAGFPQAGLGEWDLLASIRTNADAVAVGGTVEVSVRTVIIKARDGRELTVPAVRTPTSRRLAFFAGVLSGRDTRIAGVAAVDTGGRRIPLPRSVPDGRCAGADAGVGSAGRVFACSSSSTKS